jgi:hypothetical protein
MEGRPHWLALRQLTRLVNAEIQEARDLVDAHNLRERVGNATSCGWTA